MFKSLALTVLAAFALVTFMPAAQAATEIGASAPDFTGTDSHGKTHKLSDFKGKTVVLEWTNPSCPYVEKHYEPKNMQGLQEKYTGEDVVWLTINSSADGKQGNLTPEEANTLIEEEGVKSTAYILDPEGTIGKLYDAKTTPHMFVIDKEGTLVYAGAIDSDDSFKSETIDGATNYVAAALDALAQGAEVEIASTKPYGCSVKY